MNASDPLAVFHAAVSALDRGAWEEAAELCDPVSLSFFKQNVSARLNAQPALLTVEQLLEGAPEMPREVAEHEVARINERRNTQKMLADELPTVGSIDELHALTPLQVFAAWLEGRSPERQLQQAADDADNSAELVELLRAHPLRWEYHVVGVVSEGERLAHVLYRSQLIGNADEDDVAPDPQDVPQLTREESEFLKDHCPEQLHIETLRRQADGSWRMMAEHGFLGRQNMFFGIVHGG